MASEATPEKLVGLVDYLVRPLVEHPDSMRIDVVEGLASVLLELHVHRDDVQRVKGEGRSRLRAMQQVLAVAGGPRKPVLDLIEADAPFHEE